MNGVKKRPFSHRSFAVHLVRNAVVGLILIAVSLGIGMLGYHHYEKMNWVDAYVNAAMILSGMGPLSKPETVEGNLFAGTYALFSGIIFLVIIGIMFIPLFHRFFRKLHIELTDPTRDRT